MTTPERDGACAERFRVVTALLDADARVMVVRAHARAERGVPRADSTTTIDDVVADPPTRLRLVLPNAIVMA